MKNNINIQEAEKDIKYAFNQTLKLIERHQIMIDNVVFFFNKDDIVSGFVRQGNTSENEFQKNIQRTGKQLKPKITLMVSNSQMTIAHHLTKLTSIFVHKNPESNKAWIGWEEVW